MVQRLDGTALAARHDLMELGAVVGSQARLSGPRGGTRRRGGGGGCLGRGGIWFGRCGSLSRGGGRFSRRRGRGRGGSTRRHGADNAVLGAGDQRPRARDTGIEFRKGSFGHTPSGGKRRAGVAIVGGSSEVAGHALADLENVSRDKPRGDAHH